MNTSPRTVLITGGSEGIGKALAERYAQLGDTLVLVARDKSKLNQAKKDLESTHNATVITLSYDLSDPKNITQLASEIEAKKLTIDVLINNAGFGDFKPFSQANPEKMQQMIQLNITGLTLLTQAFLPKMLERNAGQIVNLGSIASFVPGPNMAVYYATKAYVLSFSEALMAELQHTNVAVTAICPGPTSTGFETAADMETSGMFDRLNAMSVDEATEAIFKAIERKQAIFIPGLQNKLLPIYARLLPRWLVRNIMARVQR